MDDKTITPQAPQQPDRPNSSADGSNAASQQAAAANIARSQIDALYSGAPENPHVEIEQESPYNRSHNPDIRPNLDAWQQYHSAWQNYYQQYYAGYYAHHLKQQQEHGAIGSATAKQTGIEDRTETINEDEALYELRKTLLEKVQQSAHSVRRSRHFIPIMSAVVVVLIFGFLQYNRLIFASVAAYVSPGSIDPQNIVIDPSSNVQVSNEPRLIIPKINVDVPAIYGIGNDYDSQMTAMEKGVAHFAIPGASSVPGQVGNTVLSGHSSNDLFDSGDYKFIFAQLDKLTTGDSIYAHYNGTRYTYTVTKKEVVQPTEVQKLVYDTDKPVLTLITCTPLGTALNRLLVTAVQVSPDPAKSTAAPATSSDAETAALPGNSPTLFERIFGGGGDNN